MHTDSQWKALAKDISSQEWIEEYNKIYKNHNEANYSGNFYSFLNKEPLAWAYRFILSSINSLDTSDLKILEIGCLNGFFIEKLLEEGYDVIGGDIIHEAIKLGNAHLSSYGERLFFMDINNLPRESNEFDVTLCVETLEHIRNYKGAIAELIRVTKPGGRVLITVPHLNKVKSPYHLHSFDIKWLKDFEKSNEISIDTQDPFLFCTLKVGK